MVRGEECGTRPGEGRREVGSGACHAALLKKKKKNVYLGFMKGKADFEDGMFLTETTACKMPGSG